MQFRRIGFRPFEAPIPLEARVGNGVVNAAMRALPQMLDPIVATADRERLFGATCPREPSSALALAYFDQARSAFLVSVIARDARPAAVRVLAFDRAIDVRTDRVLRVGVAEHRATTTRPAIATRTPLEFARDGYFRDDRDGRTFFGPDPDALLDPLFESLHCFNMAPANRERPDQVGVVIRPASRQGSPRISDISGTLWMTRSPLALQSFEFRYVNLEDGVMDRRGGGHLEFRTGENGIVVIHEWMLRLVDVDRSEQPSRGASRLPVGGPSIRAIREVGGALVSAEWLDGAVLRETFPVLDGVIVGAAPRAAQGIVHVKIPGTTYSAPVSADGRFTIRDVFPGPHRVVVFDSSLTPYGIQGVDTTDVTIERGRDLGIRFALRDPWTAAQRQCNWRTTFGRSVLAIRVIDSAGARIPVELTFEHRSTPGLPDHFADEDALRGQFVVCNLTSGIMAVTAKDSLGRHAQARRAISGSAEVDTLTVIIGPHRAQLADQHDPRPADGRSRRRP